MHVLLCQEEQYMKHHIHLILIDEQQFKTWPEQLRTRKSEMYGKYIAPPYASAWQRSPH